MNGSPSTAKIVLQVIAVAFGVFGGFLGFSGIRFLFYATQQDHPILITRILYGSLGFAFLLIGISLILIAILALLHFTQKILNKITGEMGFATFSLVYSFFLFLFDKLLNRDIEPWFFFVKLISILAGILIYRALKKKFSSWIHPPNQRDILIK